MCPLRESGQLDAVSGEVTLGTTGSPAAGIRTLPTPGHTAGHQSVVVEGGRHRTIVVGDVMVHAVQVVNPEVAYGFEGDPVAVCESRRMLLKLARTTGSRVGTAHLHRPFLTVE